MGEALDTPPSAVPSADDFSDIGLPPPKRAGKTVGHDTGQSSGATDDFGDAVTAEPGSATTGNATATVVGVQTSPDALEIGFWQARDLWLDPIVAACIGSVLLAWLGFYVVLRRSAFVSAAISQLSGLGVVLALLAGAPAEGSLVPLAAGVGLGILGTGLFALPRRSVRVTPDSLLATTVVGASAVSLVAARYLARDYEHVKAALFGDAVVASASELWLISGVAAAVLLIHLLFRHRFMLVSYDELGAKAQGMPTQRWAWLLGITIGLSISVVTRCLGALPAFAFTVIPPAAALVLTDRYRVALALAVVFALVSSVGGYYVSFVQNLPTGPAMVAMCLVCFVPGVLLSVYRRAR
jgi:zinc transport system permease protein